MRMYVDSWYADQRLLLLLPAFGPSTFSFSRPLHMLGSHTRALRPSHVLTVYSSLQ
jgi:hypothetical protein